MAEEVLKEAEEKMQKSISSLEFELSGLRTGRASASLLEPVRAEVYGSKMPLNQVSSVNVTDSRMITVQVWDQANSGAVEKAINEANLGVSTQAEGQVIRVIVPTLTEERRREIAKIASKYGENAKVSIRNIRRDAIDHIRKFQKDGTLTEDDVKAYSDDMQKLTDKFIKTIEQKITDKERELTQV